MNVLLVSVLLVISFTWSLGSLQSDLQVLLNNASNLSLNTSLSLGIALPGKTISLTAGHHQNFNAASARSVPSDKWVLGSTAKMYTAAAVLRLVEAGDIESLDAKALPLMDIFWRKLNGTSLTDFLGPEIENVTVRQLLQMRSGISDFDTGEARRYQLDNPHKDLGPVESLQFLAPMDKFYCKPGSCGLYSSTNYVLLGIILAQATGASSWDKYTQAASLPTEVLSEMPTTTFSIRGPCNDYTQMHGYTHFPPTDVFNNSCTNGWTCGNLVSNAADAAYFVRALLGSGERVLSKTMQEEMLKLVPIDQGWDVGLKYGLGLMDITRMAEWKPGVLANTTLVGHGGETYGFNALTGYSKVFDFGISVAANSENTLVVKQVLAQAFQLTVNSMTGTVPTHPAHIMV